MMRAKRAIIVSQKARHIARLARIPFGFAHGGLSLRKERLFGMTIRAYCPARAGVMRRRLATFFLTSGFS